MQYLGGKSRLAKEIAGIIRPTGLWWEPFCGGLSVSVQLAKFHKVGIVSDANPALISLYQAVRNGWIPPDHLTEELYESYKNLPNSDPLKAFVGFGCSRSGMWFAGFSGNRTVYSRTHPTGMRQDPVQATKRALIRDIQLLSETSIACLSFFELPPGPNVFESIYCDPPYKNTTGYRGFENFDHDMFWKYCIKWASFSRVYVSELSCPVDNEVVWHRSYEKRLGSGGGQINSQKVEKLFLVGG